MSNTFLALMFLGALTAVVLLARLLKSRNPGGYRRRFVNGAPGFDTAPGHDTTPSHDTAFPFASTLYVGDGGSGSHSHHHSVDCSHSSDAGSGCSDGGGGVSH
jgi:hypothetical protein